MVATCSYGYLTIGCFSFPILNNMNNYYGYHFVLYLYRKTKKSFIPSFGDKRVLVPGIRSRKRF